MKRFRFTVLAICLILAFLGGTDLRLFLANPSPQSIGLAQLEQNGPPREWLTITDATLNVEQAISTSGDLKIEVLLVPLTLERDQKTFKVLAETRDPELVELFTTYHLKFDSVAEREAYLEAHRDEFHPRRALTGMVMSSLIATGNRDKLLELAKEVGMEVSPDVIFITEAKEPAIARGLFFVVMAALGFFRLFWDWRKGKRAGL